MAEPSNLRYLFGETPPSQIDVAAVISRSRRRRAPRLIGTTSLAVLAVGGVLYAGVVGIGGGQAQTASDAGGAPAAESMEGNMGLFTDDAGRSDLTGFYSCGATAAPEPAGSSELAVSIAVPAEVAVGAASVDGAVTVTNTGATALETAPSLAVAIARDNVVVALGTSTGSATALGPGESVVLPMTVVLSDCASGDALAGELEVVAVVAAGSDSQVASAYLFAR